jgi:hypothetical protein
MKIYAVHHPLNPIQHALRCSLPWVCALMLTGVLAPLALAQPVPPQYANEAALAVDPPSRAGRLSEVQGQVWLYTPHSSAEWTKAARNRPLTAGDRVATTANGRAEVQVGSTTLRLDVNSEVEVLALDDERLALQLHNGQLMLRARDLENNGSVEITTEEGRFVVQRAGNYRFDRGEAATHATVYSGQARFQGVNNTGLSINAGSRAEFWVDAQGVAQYNTGAPLNDGFKRWSNDRDRRAAEVASNSATLRYVSPEMTGAAELDRYGRWEDTTEYGAVWFPAAVAANWAPYRNGHWAWVQPWGWTWVDDAPWGFAPFHYGRWVYWRNSWCWTPGARTTRPVYAPALVAWVGQGDIRGEVHGGHRDHGRPNVGWFPLAPREVYVPSYRVSSRYAQSINVTHVTNVAQITAVINAPLLPRLFENHRHGHAITVVPEAVLTQRRPVAPAAAQWRAPQVSREITANPNRITVVSAPQVITPVAPVRGATAERPAGLPTRWHGEGHVTRTVETSRPVATPQAQPPSNSTPAPEHSGRRHPGVAREITPANRAEPVVRAEPPVQRQAVQQPQPQAQPQQMPVQRATPAAAPEMPTMRAQPVRRVEENRAEPPTARPAAAPRADQNYVPERRRPDANDMR